MAGAQRAWAGSRDCARVDAGVALVIEAWPVLPQAFRETILVVVRAARAFRDLLNVKLDEMPSL